MAAAKRVRTTAPRRHVDTRQLPDEALVRIGEVSDLIGLSERTIRNLLTLRNGKVPRPIPKRGAGINFWVLGVVRTWVRDNRRTTTGNDDLARVLEKKRGPKAPSGE